MDDPQPSSTNIDRLPEPIKRAARLGELVVFVGAGLSALCESPLWDGFADSMIDHLGGDDGLSFLEREQLKAIKDARRRASIAMAFAIRTKKQIDYERILHPHKTPDGLEVYQLLSAMNPVFVTTNYDRWLDRISPPPTTSPADEHTDESAGTVTRRRKVYYFPEEFLLDTLNEPGSVIHLHGSCTAPDSMVISLRQYISHYTNSYVTEFLKELFHTRTVLFIGYGLSELELLEYIVKFTPKTDKNGIEPKHFLLYAYRSTEAKQLNFLSSFFQDMGIKLLPYCIDMRGYETVIEVLRGWREQIDVRGPTFIDCQYQIDRILADASSKPRRDAIIHMIQNDEELAQYFFSKVTGLIWLEDLLVAGFYDPKLNPKPELSTDKQYWNVTIWPALQYLERAAEEAAASGNSSAITRILGVLSAVTVHAHEQGLDNTRTWWLLAKTLAKLPTAVISPETIDLVDVWLSSHFDATLTGHTLGRKFLPRLLESNDVLDHVKAARLLGHLTKLRKSKHRDEYDALIGSHELKEILEKNIQSLARTCGMLVVQLLIDRLKESLESPESDKYGYVWRRAIEDHEQNQNYEEDIRSIFLNGVRDALLVLALENPNEAGTIVRQLLQSEFQTLQRLGIYIWGERYQSFGKKIWNQFDDLWLGDLPYWHEIWWFLKKVFPYISKVKSLRGPLLSAIFEGESRGANNEDEEYKYKSLQIRRLLSSIQGLGDSEVDTRYKQIVEKFGRESDHPDFLTYSMGGGFVVNKSPLSVEELLKLTPDELIHYLNSYKPAQGWHEPNEEGLGNALQKAIQDYPEKFDAMLERFMEVSVVYQHYLFRAFNERFKERNELPWDQILNLGHRVVAQDDFLHQLSRPVSEGFNPNPRWIISDIADLINGAAKDDERPIPPGVIKSASSLLRTLLRVTPSDAEAKELDAMSQAINTSRGRLLEAFIALSLQRARFAHKAQGNHKDVWSDIREVFEQELALSLEGKSYEFATLAVTYLPNFHYLDSDWVKHNFEKVFPLDKPAIWRCAAQGFAYTHAYHDWLFELLRTDGHLERMLQFDMDQGHVCEKALQYLAIAYLNGEEELGAQDSLLRRVIVELREAQINHLCWFFWTYRKSGLAKPERQRIIDLWSLISDKVKGKEAQHKEILSAASLLAEFFEDISPMAEALWAQSAVYAEEAHHGYTFVELLATHASTSPAAVARVFLAALKNGFVPTYDPKDIYTCVERLFQSDEMEAAMSICEIYERKGPRDLLRPLYDKYRK